MIAIPTSGLNALCPEAQRSLAGFDGAVVAREGATQRDYLDTAGPGLQPSMPMATRWKRLSERRYFLTAVAGPPSPSEPSHRLPPTPQTLVLWTPFMTSEVGVSPVSTSAKAELQQDFPDWRIIVSAQGRWWAQLWPLPREQFNRVNMVDADTCEALRAALTAVTS